MSITVNGQRYEIMRADSKLAAVSLMMLGVMACYALWRWNEAASLLLIVAFKDLAMETVRNWNKQVDEAIRPGDGAK